MPFALGTVAILGMVLLDGNVSVAQVKKDVKAAAKDAKGEDDAKEEKKVEVKYVQNIPAPKDQLINSQGVKQVAKINELIKQNWINNKVNPSDRCTDYEFIRRASLDIIGRIATEKEIGQFMSQAESTRRSWLVENLLKNPEYGENFANNWTVMLLTRTGSKKMYQEQMREWLIDQFNEKDEESLTTADKGSQNTAGAKGKSTGAERGADWSKIATRLLTATGKTNENPAVNFVIHHIGEEIRQDESKKGRASNEELQQAGKYDMVPVTSRTTRLFLGLRTQCVQCHDHPFNGEWQQNHFWGVNAFFRQTNVSQRPAMMANKKNKKDIGDPQIELSDVSEYNQKGIVQFERRSGVLLYTGMQFLDGTRVKNVSPNSTRRTELAKLITHNPYFSKVFVNRTWAHFFGKSITKDAIDDFGEHNQVTNPELLEFLADEFKQYNHNPKELIRWICNSQAYGLSSKATKSNDKQDDEVLFARMLLKSMSPEQLFDSLMTATASKIGGDKTAKTALREKWLDALVLNFGNDEGEEGSFSGTVVQALMLMNGRDINDAITDQNVGTVANVLKEKGITTAAINKLYLAALNRPASAPEVQKILDPKMYMFHNPALKGKVNPSSPQFAANYYQDLFWALLNSNEFILNH